MEKIKVNTDEADQFGISDRELIKTLYRKILMLEDRIVNLEVDNEAHEEWMKNRENKCNAAMSQKIDRGIVGNQF